MSRYGLLHAHSFHMTPCVFGRSQHRALSCHALEAFRECEVTSLSLGGCRGVRNGWVKHLLADTRCGQFIVNLDLTNCAGLTDT